MFNYLRHLTIILSLLMFAGPTNAQQEVSGSKSYFTVSGGFGFADVSEYAAASAQLGANALGQTVAYSYDRATWAGRAAAGYEISDNLNTLEDQ